MRLVRVLYIWCRWIHCIYYTHIIYATIDKFEYSIVDNRPKKKKIFETRDIHIFYAG